MPIQESDASSALRWIPITPRLEKVEEALAGEDATQSKAHPSADRFVGSREFYATAILLAIGAYLFYPYFLLEGAAAGSSDTEQFFFEVNESAGAPVLILAAWLYYRRSHLRDVLRGPGSPVAAGVVFASGVALNVWAWYTTAPDLHILSLVVQLVATLLAWGGREALRAFALPTFFLLFAAPISPVLVSAIVWPVQLLTAQYAGLLLNAIGVDCFVQGDQIHRPVNTFIVIETCSGLRSVVTLTMLTLLLIDLFERRGMHALLLFVFAPIVALLTNGIRVVTLVLNPHSDVASIHSFQGIVMLLVGFVRSVLARRSPRARLSRRRAGGAARRLRFGTTSRRVGSPATCRAGAADRGNGVMRRDAERRDTVG